MYIYMPIIIVRILPPYTIFKRFNSEFLKATRAAAHLLLLLLLLLLFKKAEREWYSPYQSEDPSPTIPAYRQKEEKGKNSRKL